MPIYYNMYRKTALMNKSFFSL